MSLQLIEDSDVTPAISHSTLRHSTNRQLPSVNFHCVPVLPARTLTPTADVTADVTSQLTEHSSVPICCPATTAMTSPPFRPACFRCCDVTRCGPPGARRLELPLIGLPMELSMPLSLRTLPVPSIIHSILLRSGNQPSYNSCTTLASTDRHVDTPSMQNNVHSVNTKHGDGPLINDSHVTSSDAIRRSQHKQHDDVTTTSGASGHVTRNTAALRDKVRTQSYKVEPGHNAEPVRSPEADSRTTLFRPYLDMTSCSSTRTASTCPPVDSQVTAVTSRRQTVTSQSRKYGCDLCGRQFSRSNTLVTHRVNNCYYLLTLLVHIHCLNVAL